MKKIAESHGEHLPEAFLYLDDIEEIAEILKGVSEKVRISSGKYLLDDLNEASQIPEKILNRFEISSSEPYLSLDMKPNQIWLFIHKDDPISRGCFEKIKKVILRRRRRLALIVNNSLCIGLFFSVPLVLITQNLKSPNNYLSLGVMTLFFYIFWFWNGYRGKFKNYTIINLKYRRDELSFWEKNKDAIMVGLLNSAVSCLIGFLIGKGLK